MSHYLHTEPMSAKLELLRHIASAFGDVVRELSRRSAGGSTFPPGDRRHSQPPAPGVAVAVVAGCLVTEAALLWILLDLLEQTVALIELWSELGAHELE